MKFKLGKSESGLSPIVVVMALGAAGAAVGGYMAHRAEQQFEAAAIKVGQDQAFSRIASGINLTSALIKGRTLVASSSASLVAVTTTPLPLSNPSSCSSMPSTSPAVSTPLWKFTPRSGSTPAKISFAPCQNCRLKNEQMELTFDSKNAALTNADYQGINGTIRYSATVHTGRRIAAEYRTTLQVPKPPTTSTADKCVMVLHTRGAHGSNDETAKKFGIPNWGNTPPNYMYWKLFVPPPPYLVASLGAIGPGNTFDNEKFPHTIWENMIDGGSFAPCNRSSRRWECFNEFKHPPLEVNVCGERKQIWTNYIPGSGTCTANCTCYLGRPPTSPLVIDFAGKGVKFSATLDEFVKFDLGMGPDMNTAWIRNGDVVGFVAYDKDRNGKIDSVHELFGDKTVGPDGLSADQGFEALSKYDANKDSKIDANDPIYADLLVWFDRNADGKTDAGELKKLSDMGVAAIDLNYVAEITQADENGNESKYTGKAVLADGKTLNVYDVYFDGFAKMFASHNAPIDQRRISREHVKFEVH